MGLGAEQLIDILLRVGGWTRDPQSSLPTLAMPCFSAAPCQWREVWMVSAGLAQM